MQRGDYLPLATCGQFAERVVAFARHLDGRWLIVVAPRLLAGLGLAVGQAPIGAAWGDTVVELPTATAGDGLPAGTCLRDTLSGREHRLAGATLALADLLADFPLALLETCEPALR